MKLLETMAESCNLKAMHLNVAAINLLIHRLSTDEVNFGELLTFVSDRLYTEIFCKISKKNRKKINRNMRNFTLSTMLMT